MFKVFKDKIVVECNEDGFTEANLRAICSVGKSSKVGAQGYIGEKGIGFKSVFKIAWKVHIQSGNFSFCFEHRPGDTGMGMISPVWVDPAPDWNRAIPLTRMAFFLHDDSDASLREAQRKNITEQLRELKPEMLIFLKNTKLIETCFYDKDGEHCSMSAMQMSGTPLGDGQHRVVIETYDVATNSPKREPITKNYYHVTKQVVTGLARSENRDYSSEETTGTDRDSTAEVVLAFPLLGESVPIIEPQHLFAFLPLRCTQFFVSVNGSQG